MATNRLKAAQLLSAGELTVFEASLGSALGQLTVAQLPALIKRARVMRDKARDLHRRQRVATRVRTASKAGTSGAANQRTAHKHQALDEALKRFEQRLAQLEVDAARPAPKPAAKKAAVTRPVAKKAAKKTTAAAVAAAPAAKRPTRSAKAPATGPTPAGPGLPPASPGARARDALQQRKFTGSQAIQAHVGARGRRQQARRDSKK